jgi:hypothetical protein
MTISPLDDEFFFESQKQKGWFFLVRRDGDGLKISVTEPCGEGTSIEKLNSKVHGLIYRDGKLEAEFKLGSKTKLHTCASITLVENIPEQLGPNLIEVAREATDKFLAFER